jgi:hypothetical protein
VGDVGWRVVEEDFHWLVAEVAQGWPVTMAMKKMVSMMFMSFGKDTTSAEHTHMHIFKS